MTRAVLLAALTLSTGSLALVSRDNICCFHLDSYGGGPGGRVGQLSDGQNRVGQTNLPAPQGQYCIKNGGLTDAQGRGCLTTDISTQWQCDQGAAPETGFALTCNGTLTHSNGDDTFFACPTGDHGGWNIYSQPVSGEPRCTPIWLHSDGCNAPCASPPKYTPPAPAPAPKDKCPMRLPEHFEFPHLIVPVDKNNPNKQYGTSYNGTVSPSISSIFNFDIPISSKGRQCSLQFLFPEANTLETSAFELSGDGQVTVSQCSGIANSKTSYSNAPQAARTFNPMTLTPGNAYDIVNFACPAGQAIAFQMSTAGNTVLNYFQDFNPCPIGMYIVVS